MQNRKKALKKYVPEVLHGFATVEKLFSSDLSKLHPPRFHDQNARGEKRVGVERIFQE